MLERPGEADFGAEVALPSSSAANVFPWARLSWSPVRMPLQPATCGGDSAPVSSQCQQRLLVLEPIEQGVQGTGQGSSVIVSVATQRPRRKPADDVAEEVVLASGTSHGKVPEHVKDDSHGGFVGRGHALAAQHPHVGRNVDAVDVPTPVLIDPGGQGPRERELVRPGALTLDESAEVGPSRTGNDPRTRLIVAIWPSRATTLRHRAIVRPDRSRPSFRRARSRDEVELGDATGRKVRDPVHSDRVRAAACESASYSPISRPSGAFRRGRRGDCGGAVARMDVAAAPRRGRSPAGARVVDAGATSGPRHPRQLP